MSLFQMEPNPDIGKQIQYYVPTIQDFAIEPRCQIQTQTHPMHPEIKIENQYESLIEFLPLAYSKVVKSAPHITQKPPTSQLQVL